MFIRRYGLLLHNQHLLDDVHNLPNFQVVKRRTIKEIKTI